MDDFSQFLMGGQAKAPPPQANPASNQGGVITDAILDSLKRTESGKQKFALNKESGAMGDYQFIPSTVKMLHEQGYEFNPFNPAQAREAAKHYLTTLVNKTGSLEKARAAYGVHITKDPAPYVNKVVGGAQQTPATQSTTQESSDPFSSFLMGGKTEAPAEKAKEPKQALKPKLFGQAEGAPTDNQSFMDKFAERSKKMQTNLEPLVGAGEAAISTIYNPAVAVVGAGKGIVQSIPEAIKTGQAPAPIGERIGSEFVNKYASIDLQA